MDRGGESAGNPDLVSSVQLLQLAGFVDLISTHRSGILMELDADRAVDDDADGQSKTEQPRIEEEDEKKSSNKGKGLKKWKRIQRTTIAAAAASNTSASASAGEEEDLHRFLKRDSRRFVVPHTSSGGGGDSDNSESKSSTAASAPTKFRNHHHHHHHRTSAAANRTPSSTHRPSNTKIETTKKLRGGDNDRDRDVSYSSVESDLRSSNVFSNGRRHIRYDDVDHSDQHSNDYFKPNAQDDDDDEELSAAATINRPTTSQDLLTDAILSLHAVHQALQKEIQSFGEIGKEAVVLKADELVFEEEVKGKLESRVGELERELLGIKEEGEESKWREMEQLFTHKIEAEIQCLVIRQKFKDQNNNKNIAFLLHTDTSSEDDDPLKLRTAASKYGLCFFVQFIFLFLVLLRLLFLQLWPGSTGFVPT